MALDQQWAKQGKQVVQRVWHTWNGIMAQVLFKPNQIVYFKDIWNELHDLLVKEMRRRNSSCSEPEDQLETERKALLTSVRNLIVQEMEYSFNLSIAKAFAHTKALLASSSIAARPSEQPCCISLHVQGHAERCSELMESHTEIEVISALPLQGAQACDCGSLESFEVPDLEHTEGDIIAKASIQPKPEPITVSWKGIWAELVLISRRQKSRHELNNMEGFGEASKQDKATALKLLKTREAIRVECERRHAPKHQ